MTFNHLKTNSAKFSHHRFKIREVIESLTFSPWCNIPFIFLFFSSDETFSRHWNLWNAKYIVLNSAIDICEFVMVIWSYVGCVSLWTVREIFKIFFNYVIALRVHPKRPYCIIRFDWRCVVTWLPANRMVKGSSYLQSRTSCQKIKYALYVV